MAKTYHIGCVRLSVAALSAGIVLTAIGTARAFPDPTSCGSPTCTADGIDSLENNTGADNAAFGYDAMMANTVGVANTALGAETMALGIGGQDDTAIGYSALHTNIGGDNTATGAYAMIDNGDGSVNVADGVSALSSNNTGSFNTAVGGSALLNNTKGSSNIALGDEAGFNLTSGDDNIDIGNKGHTGEGDTIRIGVQGTQTTTYVAGIFGHTIKQGCAVEVANTGLLGCPSSSSRYKRDIQNMDDASDRLMKLRPVTFRYKSDPTARQQYGLVAEEVAKVYPELVVNDAAGRPETVEYQVLPAMLLNEIQKQSRQIAEKDAKLAALERQMAALRQKERQIDALATRLDALEHQVRASWSDGQTTGRHADSPRHDLMLVTDK